MSNSNACLVGRLVNIPKWDDEKEEEEEYGHLIHIIDLMELRIQNYS